MRSTYRILFWLTPFFFAAAAVYGIWTYNRPGGWEPVGTLAIALEGLLVLMIGFYLRHTARRLEAQPEDDPAGEIAEKAGEYGVFAPWSWWPFMLGLSAAIVFLGMAAGWWLMIIGVALAGVSLVGWVFEYSRGVHAH